MRSMPWPWKVYWFAAPGVFCCLVSQYIGALNAAILFVALVPSAICGTLYFVNSQSSS